MFKKILLAAVLASPAVASAGVYFVVGGAAGSSDLGDIEASYTNGMPPAVDDDVQRALIGVGASVNQYLAFEALYMTKTDNKVEDFFFRDEFEHQGIQLAVIAKAPITPQFSLFGRLSANALGTNYTFVDKFGASSVEEDDSGTYLGFGAGMEFQVNDAVGIRFQAERIQISDIRFVGLTGVEDANIDVDQASLAVTFAF